MSEQPNYFNQVDLSRLTEEYPIGPAFLQRFEAISRDELRAVQEGRFASLLRRAWGVPFYQRHWGAEGLEPGDIKGLDDIAKLPMFDKSDIMASIEAHPPFGDFHGMETYPGGQRPPVIVHATSGTTGRPQVLLYGPRSREIQNLLVARTYLLQGLRPDDVVQSVYGHGMVNGGHYIREAVVHWTNTIFLPAGTGIETRSVQQVGLMQDFGVTVLVGFADYIKRLADVAREEGLEPGRDIKIRMISGHMGREDNLAGAARRSMIGTASAIPAPSPARDRTRPGCTSGRTPNIWRSAISTPGRWWRTGSLAIWSIPACSRTISIPSSASTPTM